MKYLLTIFLSLITIHAIHATEPLDSVFNSLCQRSRSTKTDVKYTGTFDGKIRGFMYHRGTGNGWTAGIRLNCPDVTPETVEEVFAVFDKSAPVVGHITSLETDRACFDESSSTGYACHYNKENNSLQFLRASVEDQICIPHDWYERDFFDGSVEKIQQQLPAPEWVAALATLNTELKYNYVFYDRFRQEIDSTYKALLPEMARVTDNYEALMLLNRFIASCHDGHTYTYAGGVIEQPVSSPFTTRLINGRIYIDNVESSDLEKAGMKRGMEVVAINGVPTIQYADSVLRPYVCSSTPQWTDYLVFDKHGLSKGRKGSPLNLTLLDGKRKVEISHTVGSGRKDIPSQTDSFNFSKLKENIGLLRIPGFDSSAITELFDNVYNDILETDALIIDIRGNGGGNSGYADYIARHFSADSIASDSWRTPIYSPAFASWGHDRSWYEAPSRLMPPVEDKEPYLKPLVILIDRGTFSAAEDFSALFKGMGRAVFVGNSTGGSTGNGVRLQLNNLVSVNICSKHDSAPDGSEFVGVGIIPDITVTETPDGYFSSHASSKARKAASPADRDPYLRAALSHLKEILPHK